MYLASSAARRLEPSVKPCAVAHANASVLVAQHEAGVEHKRCGGQERDGRQGDVVEVGGVDRRPLNRQRRGARVRAAQQAHPSPHAGVCGGLLDAQGGATRVQLCGGEPEGRPGQRHQLLLLRCGDRAQGTSCSAHAWVRPASVLQVL